MNIVLTGVTGTLGSQLLLELLKKKDVKKIHLLIRETKTNSSNERFLKMINSDVFCIFKNQDLIYKKVVIYNSQDFLIPSNYLNKADKNYFIHSAGLVNLSTDESLRESIFNENLDFTKVLFETFNSIITKFTYISTAFAIGDIGDIIQNEYHTNIIPNYRNAYEEAKHQTEKYLLRQSKVKNIDIQILRPSVLGGNIFNAPKYFISKYMVYYLLGKFFYKNPLIEKSEIRISANLKTGLNIIPTDYVAKVIVKVFTSQIEQLNIVHNTCTNFQMGIRKILELVDFENYTLINNIANKEIYNKNRLEKYYYSTIGNHLSPYLLAKPHEFDTKILEKIYPIPKYNLEEYLANTIYYAIQKDFKNEKW
jgi:nucleoside-diphosphate-sugar epimerase